MRRVRGASRAEATTGRSRSAKWHPVAVEGVRPTPRTRTLAKPRQSSYGRKKIFLALRSAGPRQGQNISPVAGAAEEGGGPPAAPGAPVLPHRSGNSCRSAFSPGPNSTDAVSSGNNYSGKRNGRGGRDVEARLGDDPTRKTVRTLPGNDRAKYSEFHRSSMQAPASNLLDLLRFRTLDGSTASGLAPNDGVDQDDRGWRRPPGKTFGRPGAFKAVDERCSTIGTAGRFDAPDCPTRRSTPCASTTCGRTSGGTHDGGNHVGRRSNDGLDNRWSDQLPIREDPKRKGLFCMRPLPSVRVYVSFDDGDHWQSLQLNNGPLRPVRDIIVQRRTTSWPATHGRGFWILGQTSRPLRADRGERDGECGLPVLFKPQDGLSAFPLGNTNTDTAALASRRAGRARIRPEGAIIDYLLEGLSRPVPSRWMSRTPTVDSYGPITRAPIPVRQNRIQAGGETCRFTGSGPPMVLSTSPGHGNRFTWGCALSAAFPAEAGGVAVFPISCRGPTNNGLVADVNPGFLPGTLYGEAGRSPEKNLRAANDG